jgi:hypothetical protein
LLVYWIYETMDIEYRNNATTIDSSLIGNVDFG